jgi:hypothetical protein
MGQGIQHAWDYQKCIESCVLTKLKRTYLLEELGVDRKIILK